MQTAVLAILLLSGCEKLQGNNETENTETAAENLGDNMVQPSEQIETATNEPEIPIARVPVGALFTSFPAERMTGPFKLPSFTGDQREYATFRTRLTEAAKTGVNFAGSANLEIIGCGYSCTFTFIIDGETGRITGFPLAGENYLSLGLNFKPDSRLIKATWDPTGEHEKCGYAEFLYENGAVKQVSRGTAEGDCPFEPIE